MARRWTPQRFIKLRRIRIAVCVFGLIFACGALFALTARKAVALTVDGHTTNVTTYAMSVDRLLEEHGITKKSHDEVTSASGGVLTNHDVVTMQSAYQATINLNGRQVPFWTVATSADQLLDFFKANEKDAAKVTVDITNVYNQLTGGFIINKDGPVTVIADGKTSVAPDGKLPAASILDSKGIVLNKEDRVSVEEDNGQTILRVRRVTHGEETRTISIPFGTQTIIDAKLASGQTEIRQTGENGERQDVYNITYVDGVAESETLESQTTTKIAIDQIVAIGPDKSAPSDDSKNGSANSGSNDGQNDSNKDPSTPGSKPSDNPGTTPSTPSTPGNGGGTKPDNPGGNGGNNSGGDNGGNNNGGGNGGNTPPSPSGLWHPTSSQAQAYAAGAAAQYGWTGQNWTDLVKLWNRESSWLWYAENPSSHAYGIPQSLPGDKMATFGANWRDDASIQIAWGLNYISQRYGSPSAAWQHSEQYGWY